MTAYLLPFIYLGVCALTAYFGRNTRIGYWGTFVLSIFVSPFLVIVGLLLLGTVSRRQA